MGDNKSSQIGSNAPFPPVPYANLQAFATALVDSDLNRLDLNGHWSPDWNTLYNLKRVLGRVITDFYGDSTGFTAGDTWGNPSVSSWNGPVDMHKMKLFSEKNAREVRQNWTIGQTENFILSPVDMDVDVDTLSSLLNKTVLYGGTSVMVLPMDVHWDTGMGPAGLQHLQPIMQLNARYQRLVASGLTVMLPYFFMTSFLNQEGPLVEIGEFWRAPLQQEAEFLRYLPMNRATVDREKETQVLHQFLLPYFPDYDLSAMRKIVENESAAFMNFTAWLKAQLADLAKQQSQNGMQHVFDRIDSGVNDIRIEAEKLKRLRVLDGVRLGAFSVGIAANVADIPSLRTAATIIGAASLLDLAKEHAGRRSARLDLKKNSFYIPYLISRHSR